jgi:hypothetical protein
VDASALTAENWKRRDLITATFGCLQSVIPAIGSDPRDICPLLGADATIFGDTRPAPRGHGCAAPGPE